MSAVFRRASPSSKDVTPEELEEQMQAAAKAEDFATAARLRDQLQELMLDGEAAVLCANREFYAAFQACDAERMEALWLNGSRSCCVHPGNPPIHGHEAVSRSWASIFSRRSGMDIECLKPSVVVSGNIGRVVCFEKVDGGLSLAAVNLFESTSNGWKMWYHQAGLVEPMLMN